MELTPQEQRLLKPYLRMAAGEGRGWLMGVAVGLAVCAGAVAVVALGR